MSEIKKWEESVMMRAARKLPVSRVPVWLMRQAGRYMPEYRAVREKTTFLELCKNPPLAAEVMLTAVDKLKVDAAIIFSDLLPILEPMGFSLEFSANDGPVVHSPIRTADDLTRVRELSDVSPLDFVLETVRKTREGLDESTPVIGFAGAPFTLAGYAVEGGTSRDFRNTKRLMYSQPDVWHELLRRIAVSVANYLIAQVDAGAQILQIFDSWVGCLSCGDYRQYVLPHSKTVVNLVRESCPDTPIIHFGAGNPMLLPLFREAGGDVIGADWRIAIDDAWAMIGQDCAIQGNLDPIVLLSDWKTIERQTLAILQKAAHRNGYIFNLGHGVLPQTPVKHVVALVEMVKTFPINPPDQSNVE
ncbi:MAG: uroporphyrinogen decarboxylase [Planctomycetaceae bacterium]|nr:uroporphyrinogen decarboxylase [Planctomycetaceae bacterium]